MKTYEFNEHGVCTNPDVFMQVQGKEYAAELKVCQLTSGQWTYGYMMTVNFGNYGGCAGPASLNGPEFPSKEEAKKAATTFYLKRINEMLQSARDWNARQRYDQGAKQDPQTTLF